MPDLTAFFASMDDLTKVLVAGFLLLVFVFLGATLLDR